MRYALAASPAGLHGSLASPTWPSPGDEEGCRLVTMPAGPLLTGIGKVLNEFCGSRAQCLTHCG